MSSTPSLSTRAVSSWEANASYWDATITKEGNKYWRRLQEPCLARLLAPSLFKPNVKALDLATGNGLCARWLVSHLADSVLATDASENMLDLARRHCQLGTLEEGIRFRQVDVTSEGDMARLVEEEAMPRGGFDVVLMNMAIMDVADLEPLAKALGGGLLAKGGVFVATLLHPVFFTSNAERVITVGYNPATGNEEIVRGKLIKEYMSVPPAMGIAVPGQPEKQLYFHRPMHELFATFFKTDLVMDAMEELAFTEEDVEENRIQSTTNFPQLPVILAFRMRLP
ncbi:S-adenosyl-L-methionine-dependent methyltransferase [Parathielavia hyrcaniae]|uniref:S-adenosyl-L-methionine-dependent methyltransferase n=1 Tax=Parathielavia hyrcaniae TaxID=113614 RepID=A0AAN6PTF1_9PEZI|nr:S-adenosyl-L-methionine-dependent methyltransferase [Parathielavia hyrcaniae]